MSNCFFIVSSWKNIDSVFLESNSRPNLVMRLLHIRQKYALRRAHTLCCLFCYVTPFGGCFDLWIALLIVFLCDLLYCFFCFCAHLPVGSIVGCFVIVFVFVFVIQGVCQPASWELGRRELLLEDTATPRGPLASSLIVIAIIISFTLKAGLYTYLSSNTCVLGS